MNNRLIQKHLWIFQADLSSKVNSYIVCSFLERKITTHHDLDPPWKEGFNEKTRAIRLWKKKRKINKCPKWMKLHSFLCSAPYLNYIYYWYTIILYSETADKTISRFGERGETKSILLNHFSVKTSNTYLIASAIYERKYSILYTKCTETKAKLFVCGCKKRCLW